jgi:hypothetical protein
MDKEKPTIESSWRELERNLQDLITNRIDLLPCLEAGYKTQISVASKQLAKLKANYQEARLGTGYTSYEINDGLLGMRDEVGYADLLLGDFKLKLSSSVSQDKEILDRELKMFLPIAIAEFRQANDDPTPNSDAFPLTFWWRRIP